MHKQWIVGGGLALSLVVAACGSSGSKTAVPGGTATTSLKIPGWYPVAPSGTKIDHS